MMFQRVKNRGNAPVSGRAYRTFAFVILAFTLLPGIPFFKNMLGSNIYLYLPYRLFIIGSILFIVPAVHVPGKLSMRGTVSSYAAAGAGVYIALGFGAGVLLKCLKASPYDLSASGLVYNILSVLSLGLLWELARAYCIGSICRGIRFKRTKLVLLTLIMGAARINYSKLAMIEDTESLVVFIVCDVMLILAGSCLLSVLVYYGGAAAGFIYIVMIEIFERVFPFIPDLPWLCRGAVGIAFPILYAMYTEEHLKPEGRPMKPNEGRGNIAYLFSLFLVIMFSWFCVGVFPIYPSVVLTGSMEPLIIPGDVVLISRISDEKQVYELHEGEIIHFKRGDISIIHRISEVITDEAGNTSFITKGDNNTSEDKEAVMPENLRGRIIKIVPKAGIPVLLINSVREIPKGVVDNDEREQK